MEETGRLDSWKQIAAYLGKSERTVRRWQETEGLPVHRHVHQQRGSVWAYRAEIDDWRERRQQTPEPLPEARQRISWRMVSALLLAAGLIGTGAGLLLKDNKPPAEVLDTVQITALPGAVYTPSFAPSGRQIVFHWSSPHEKKSGLFIKTIGEEGISPLITAPRAEGQFIYSPAWSPDGVTIAFLNRIRPTKGYAMYATKSETWLCLIAAAGGTGRRLVRLAEDVLLYANNNHLSWSPDSRFLFAPMVRDGRQAIHRISVDTAEAVRLTPGVESEFAPAVSPDGRSLAFVRAEGWPPATIRRVLRQDLEHGGAPRGQPRELFVVGAGVSGLGWLPSGRELVICVADSSYYGNFGSRLFRLPAESSSPPVPLGLGGGCSTLAISPPDRRGSSDLVFATGENTVARVLRTHLSELDNTIPVAPSSRFDALPTYSPDGSEIAFVSNRSGQLELWAASNGGGEARRLTTHSDIVSSPRWSPVGARLVYGSMSLASGSPVYGIHTVAKSGGAPVRVPIDQPTPSDPFWSPDGSWIYYWSDARLWRARPDGTAAAPAGEYPAHFARAAAIDGGALYYTIASQPFALWRASLDGGTPSIVAEGLASPFFAVTGKFVYYIRDWTLHAHPLHGGSPRRIGLLPDSKGLRRILLGLSVSHDDGALVWGITGEQQLDLQLVRGLR